SARIQRAACSSRAIERFDALIARERVVGRLVEAGVVTRIHALDQTERAFSALHIRHQILPHLLVLALREFRSLTRAARGFPARSSLLVSGKHTSRRCDNGSCHGCHWMLSRIFV